MKPARWAELNCGDDWSPVKISFRELSLFLYNRIWWPTEKYTICLGWHWSTLWNWVTFSDQKRLLHHCEMSQHCNNWLFWEGYDLLQYFLESVLFWLPLYRSLFLIWVIRFIPPTHLQKVILFSCHWRAALPSHKSITLPTNVLLNLNLNYETVSSMVGQWYSNNILLLIFWCIASQGFSPDDWFPEKHPPSLFSREVISSLLECKIVKSKRRRQAK